LEARAAAGGAAAPPVVQERWGAPVQVRARGAALPLFVDRMVLLVLGRQLALAVLRAAGPGQAAPVVALVFPVPAGAQAVPAAALALRAAPGPEPKGAGASYAGTREPPI